MQDLKDRYETFEYSAIPFVQTHPTHLATMGQLHGMRPADPRRCRYLELGCANALNIIGMACAFPESQFVGIDLAETSIKQGVALVNQLGLKNVQLIAGDVLEFPLDVEAFDYIVAHGFYSWVPDHVQQHVWRLLQKLLTEQGIAFISYNTYPGCYLRRMLREMMMFHVREENEPEAKVYQAKAFLQFLDNAQAIHGEVVATIRHEIDQLLNHRQSYSIYHDDLAPLNVPLYFHQFISVAAHSGFQFLSEADYFEMCYHHFPEKVQSHLSMMEQHDFLLKEQYLDFLKLRRFRESLVCRDTVLLDRQVSMERVQTQLYTSRSFVEGELTLLPEEVTTFYQEKGARISVNHPLSKAAMNLLGQTFPRHWSFAELQAACVPVLQQANLAALNAEDEALLAHTLLSAYSVGLLEMHSLAPAMAVTAPELPRVSALVAEQLKMGSRLVVNQMHLPVHIDSDFIAGFLQRCDGTRTKDALIRDCQTLAGDVELSVAARVEHALQQGLKLALLLPD